MNIKELLDSNKDKKRFMLGNEAAVRGVLESGVSLAATYPGTPSSEIGDILFKVAKDANIYFEFSSNEKVAVEVAASAASSGLRTFSFMKHVGVNVASDSLMTSAYMGVEGSFLLLVADDPSTFSSQNEQDTRHFARQANIPIFEPSNPQEIKDFIHYAYDISDKYNIPVILRTTTRVSHMRGIVKTDTYTKNEVNKGLYENIGLHVPVPEIARTMHKNLIEKIHDLREISNKSPLNQLFDNGADIGIITSGGAYNYVCDVLNQNNVNEENIKFSYVGAASELAPLVISEQAKYAILPEPALSTVLSKNKNIKIILNLNEEWKKENNVMEGYPQSTLLIKEDFYNKLKESNLYDELINRFIDSEKWVKNNPQLTAEKCEKFKITVNKDTIDELIKNSNLRFTKISDCKNEYEVYFSIIDQDSEGKTKEYDALFIEE